MSAVIRYYSNFSIEPDDLNDEQFSKIWNSLEYVLYDDEEKKLVLK